MSCPECRGVRPVFGDTEGATGGFVPPAEEPGEPCPTCGWAKPRIGVYALRNGEKARAVGPFLMEFLGWRTAWPGKEMADLSVDRRRFSASADGEPAPLPAGWFASAGRPADLFRVDLRVWRQDPPLETKEE